MIRLLARLAILLLTVASATPASADPADLKDFGLVCFCTSKVATPHRLVNTGNNGRILLLARNGVTKSQLTAAGETVSGRQLQELRDWGLLRAENGRVITSFPILGSNEMTALRARLEPIATQLSRKIAPDLKAVKAELERRRQSPSAEAVLFAYILDGLTWRALNVAHALPSQEIDAAHPYWNGTFWAVYPKQDNVPGTNSQTIGNRELRMMWTPPVLSWFDRVKDRPVSNAVLVREASADPIYIRGQRVAENIATTVTSAKLDDVIESADQKQRILIATHELIWMLLDRANRDLGFAPPAVLKTGARSLEDVTPLIVISEPAGKR